MVATTDGHVAFPQVTAILDCYTPGWQIITYVDGAGRPPRYAAVYHGRRRAWGLHTEQAAARWIARLAQPVQPALLAAPAHPVQAVQPVQPAA